eukprot:TRINITY_DN5900_c0_g1_i1.p1 TRINITY_DN5900_c0_g1~~TRINITY_DN5900_c0_g1_i1.p1  ORF type:complete len:200 (-),score=35.69 TRINITY_DN5900_c0_g1_i1:3-602(-)
MRFVLFFFSIVTFVPLVVGAWESGGEKGMDEWIQIPPVPSVLYAVKTSNIAGGVVVPYKGEKFFSFAEYDSASSSLKTMEFTMSTEVKHFSNRATWLQASIYYQSDNEDYGILSIAFADVDGVILKTCESLPLQYSPSRPCVSGEVPSDTLPPCWKEEVIQCTVPNGADVAAVNIKGVKVPSEDLRLNFYVDVVTINQF